MIINNKVINRVRFNLHGAIKAPKKKIIMISRFNKNKILKIIITNHGTIKVLNKHHNKNLGTKTTKKTIIHFRKKRMINKVTGEIRIKTRITSIKNNSIDKEIMMITITEIIIIIINSLIRIIKRIETSPTIITSIIIIEITITIKTEIKIQTTKVIKMKDKISIITIEIIIIEIIEIIITIIIEIIIEIINNKTTIKKIIKNLMIIEIIIIRITNSKIKIIKNLNRTHGKKTTIMKINQISKLISLG